MDSSEHSEAAYAAAKALRAAALVAMERIAARSTVHVISQPTEFAETTSSVSESEQRPEHTSSSLVVSRTEPGQTEGSESDITETDPSDSLDSQSSAPDVDHMTSNQADTQTSCSSTTSESCPSMQEIETQPSHRTVGLQLMEEKFAGFSSGGPSPDQDAVDIVFSCDVNWGSSVAPVSMQHEESQNTGALHLVGEEAVGEKLERHWSGAASPTDDVVRTSPNPELNLRPSEVEDFENTAALDLAGEETVRESHKGRSGAASPTDDAVRTSPHQEFNMRSAEVEEFENTAALDLVSEEAVGERHEGEPGAASPTDDVVRSMRLSEVEEFENTAALDQVGEEPGGESPEGRSVAASPTDVIVRTSPNPEFSMRSSEANDFENTAALDLVGEEAVGQRVEGRSGAASPTDEVVCTSPHPELNMRSAEVEVVDSASIVASGIQDETCYSQSSSRLSNEKVVDSASMVATGVQDETCYSQSLSRLSNEEMVDSASMVATGVQDETCYSQSLSMLSNEEVVKDSSSIVTPGVHDESSYSKSSSRLSSAAVGEEEVVSHSSELSVCGKGEAESNVGDAPLGIKIKALVQASILSGVQQALKVEIPMGFLEESVSPESPRGSHQVIVGKSHDDFQEPISEQSSSLLSSQVRAEDSVSVTRPGTQGQSTQLAGSLSRGSSRSDNVKVLAQLYGPTGSQPAKRRPIRPPASARPTITRPSTVGGRRPSIAAESTTGIQMPSEAGISSKAAHAKYSSTSKASVTKPERPSTCSGVMKTACINQRQEPVVSTTVFPNEAFRVQEQEKLRQKFQENLSASRDKKTSEIRQQRVLQEYHWLMCDMNVEQQSRQQEKQWCQRALERRERHEQRQRILQEMSEDEINLRYGKITLSMATERRAKSADPKPCFGHFDHVQQETPAEEKELFEDFIQIYRDAVGRSVTDCFTSDSDERDVSASSICRSVRTPREPNKCLMQATVTPGLAAWQTRKNPWRGARKGALPPMRDRLAALLGGRPPPQEKVLNDVSSENASRLKQLQGTSALPLLQRARADPPTVPEPLFQQVM